MTVLTNKVALVTGGSRGIGEAIVRTLAARGASVALTYKSQRVKAERIAEDIVTAGGRALAIEADVKNMPSAQAAVDSTVKAFSGIDILVNNAGVFGARSFEEVDFHFFQEQFNVNVWGIIPITQAALKHFPKSGGRIINTSSLRAFSPRDRSGIYGASKAAVSTLTQALAIELGPRGINVNAVAPGITKTDMTAGMAAERRQLIADATPLRRVAEPDDIAAAVAFLASDDSRWITGRTILVDGGFTYA